MNTIHGLTIISLLLLGSLNGWAQEMPTVKDYDTFQAYLKKSADVQKSKTRGTSTIVELEKRKKFKLVNGKSMIFSGPAQILGESHIITLVRHDSIAREKTGYVQHLEIYDGNGKLLFVVNFDGLFSTYWLNNKLYLFTSTRGVEPGPKAKNGFYVYDSVGKLESFTEVEWTNFAFSKSGKFLAVVTAVSEEAGDIVNPSQLVVFVIDASRQWKKSWAGTIKTNVRGNDLVFTDDDRFLLVKSAGGTAFVDYDANEFAQKKKTKRMVPSRTAKGEVSIFDLNDYRLISKERK